MSNMEDFKEVKGSYPKGPDKKCEGKGCPDYFEETWPGMRRCKRCRAEKRPYVEEGHPF